MSGEPPKPLSVTQLNRRIQDLLEGAFGDVLVEGEVSDPRAYPSGHTYFTLKDAESQISCVLFKGVAQPRFKLEHGLAALVRGRVSTYLKRGQYQLLASSIEPLKAGALQLAFEQLKARLQAEGLFDPGRKRPLPRCPERVGVITSLQGAAVRDILSVLRRRFPGLGVRILPVLVQGEGAAEQVARAIEAFNAHFPDTELLLVGRGGGSLEDLWAFNEERVARAIAASRIPVVSCVGHETDFTIADFVADLRAPTPSAAAELAVPVKAELARQARETDARLRAALSSLLERLAERLRRAAASPWLKDPRRLTQQKAQRADELYARLAPALSGRLRREIERLRGLILRLAPAARNALGRAEQTLRAEARRLDDLSPLRVLARGYAIAYGPSGGALRAAKDLKPRDEVRVRLREGGFKAQVVSTEAP